MNKKIDKTEVEEPTVEEVVEEPVVTPEEKLKEVEQERDTLLQTKETLVTELQDQRKKRQLTEEEKKILADEVAKLKESGETIEPKETDVLKKVEEMFTKNKQESVIKSKDRAMDKFLAKHPELSPANDEAGLKKAAFDRKLSMFNTNTLEDESDFLSIFEDTYKLLDNKETTVEDTIEVPNTPGSIKLPKTEGIEKLSPKELKFVNDSFKGDVKRYLELKTKFPDAVPKF